MTNPESNHLKVNAEDPSLDIVLERLPFVVSGFEGLSISHEIRAQGGKGQGLAGSERFLFIHGSTIQLNMCKYVLDGIGFSAADLPQTSLGLEGLSSEEVDDLIRLVMPDNLTCFEADPTTAPDSTQHILYV